MRLRKVQKGKRKRERWAKGCETALLKIVSRREAASWWDDYSYRYRNVPHSLGLEMNSDQKAIFPNETNIEVRVSQYVYNRLEKKNTVRIYYMPESPLTFLLEEELVVSLLSVVRIRGMIGHQLISRGGKDAKVCTSW